MKEYKLDCSIVPQHLLPKKLSGQIEEVEWWKWCLILISEAEAVIWGQVSSWWSADNQLSIGHSPISMIPTPISPAHLLIPGQIRGSSTMTPSAASGRTSVMLLGGGLAPPHYRYLTTDHSWAIDRKWNEAGETFTQTHIWHMTERKWCVHKIQRKILRRK